MRKAAIYTRVSSDQQKKEGTIESQVAELKKQVTKAGDELVKEYIDNGYSGALLDRPAMNQLREDLKTGLFEAVYFLNTDRIARDTAYQQIIIGEFLRYKKNIIINGKDYIHNPENKFTLTVLGAVSELERAKIIERSMRGRKYWLKQGVLMSNGCHAFGYQYHKRTQTSNPYYTIIKQEAEIVKQIFELYAKGDISFVEIAEKLRDKNAYRRPGSAPWNKSHIRCILYNEMYTGIRYFDMMTSANENDDPMHKSKSKKMTLRDRKDWIGIEIPAIISKELFSQAKSRIDHNRECYRNARRKQLLSGLLWCSRCGACCFSFRSYHWVRKSAEKLRIYEKILYTCSRRRHPGRQCDTMQIDVRPIDALVFKMINETMPHAAKLKTYMDAFKRGSGMNKQRMEKKLKDLEQTIKEVTEKKNRIIDLYASGDLERSEYQKRIANYNKELSDLNSKLNEIAKKAPSIYKPEEIDKEIKIYCEKIKLRLEQCIDFESKRRFLLDYIEKVGYRNDEIFIRGSVPAGVSKIEFRIKRGINRGQLRDEVRQLDRELGIMGLPISRTNYGYMKNEQAEIITPTNSLAYEESSLVR